jgi:membrane protease YdiL (CAAX protease family)
MNVYPNSEMNFLDKLVNCLFTSIREEFLFRFFLMSALAFGINLVANKKVSISSSLIITSILFGISHFRIVQEQTFSWYLFLLDVAAGVILGMAYILTKSLYFSLGFHLGWNFFLGAIPVLGRFSIYNAPDWNNLLAILIILAIMTPVYCCSRTFLKLNTHWLW